MQFVRTHTYIHICHALNISKNMKHDQFILEFFPKPREMALVPERNFGNRLCGCRGWKREGMNKKQEMRPKL